MRIVARARILLLGIALCFSAGAMASTEIISVEATGRGADRGGAINAALIEALGSVEGIEIVSERTRSSNSRELLVRGSDGNEREIILGRDSAESVRTATSGFVEGFRVLRARDVEGQVEVRLEARIATFKAPGAASHTTRRRIAIYPVQSDRAYSLFGERYSAQTLGERLTQSLVEAITGTRRFAVLERDRVGALQEELAFLSSRAVAPREASRIGEAIGADYLLNARLVDMSVSSERVVNRLTSEMSTRYSGAISVEMRIVSTATRQIMWADTENIRGADLAKLGLEADAGASAVSTIFDSVAERLTERAIDAIYPMRVVSIAPNGSVVLNQGSNRLAEGDRLEVFRLGARLKDPYSGESLGREESRVGFIEVDRVTSKVAYAVPTGGSDWLNDAQVSGEDYLVREASSGRTLDGEPPQGEAPPVLLPQDL